MSDVLLTKRIEFAAAHRYYKPEWDAARNRAVFGPCANAPGHGHNYLLEVTIAGHVDPATGMVVNLYDLKRVLEAVLEEFDHKHLNLDTPYFRDRIPTTENIARVLWDLLARRPDIGRLEMIRLFEDEDLYAELTSALAVKPSCHGRLVRRYHFAAGHRLAAEGLSEAAGRRQEGLCAGSGAHGHNYMLEVVASGPVDEQTGMVLSLGELDGLVQERILSRFDRRDLNDDPGFGAGRPPTGENVVRLLWDLLRPALPALERLRLSESREISYEYAAPR